VRVRSFFGVEGDAAVQAYHGRGTADAQEPPPAEPHGVNDAAQDIERHPQ
jgi:hypothetical protein